MRKTFFILILSILACGTFSNIFCQDTEAKGTTDLLDADEISNDMQWLLGTVLLVDSQNMRLTVQYYDYDAETNSQLDMLINNKTTFENIDVFTQIRPQDEVSIDYIEEGDGNLVACNISVSRPEDMEFPRTENAPSDAGNEDSDIIRGPIPDPQ